MRVLVTGSAGHIGRWLVKTLHEAGHEIRTFDRAAKHRDDDWEHLPGDLRDIQMVRQAVQGVDAVAHLGAIANDYRACAEDLLTVNMQGTWNILLSCVEAGVERVVYFSSVQALGIFGGNGVTTRFPVDDSYPRRPLSPYQLSKHLGEEMCRSFTDRHGLVTVCLRPAYVSAPDHYARWRKNDSLQGAERTKGDYWAYVDVRDVCDATLLGLTTSHVTHDAFLLTEDDILLNVPTAELVDAYYPDMPWPTQERAAYLAEDPYRSLVNCSRAKQILGWQPKHSWRSAENSA